MSYFLVPTVFIIYQWFTPVDNIKLLSNCELIKLQYGITKLEDVTEQDCKQILKRKTREQGNLKDA